MNKKRLLIILTVFVIGAGCWSIGSKAEPSPQYQAPTNDMNEPNQTKGFLANLPKGFEHPQDDAGKHLLREYGAVFLARGGARPPRKVVFKDDADVVDFQSSLETSTKTIGGIKIELQDAAMAALNKAIDEAKAGGLSISPRGADSARRGYTQTVSLWASRVNPGLSHWLVKGRLSQFEVIRIKAMSPFQQVPEILRLEGDGLFFSKDLSKSIIYSVAPPGTSQHLSMLALDVKEFDNARVRAILARHGWFQTVVSDLPHFTYLGVSESELPGLGLKKQVNSGRDFWVPDI